MRLMRTSRSNTGWAFAAVAAASLLVGGYAAPAVGQEAPRTEAAAPAKATPAVSSPGAAAAMVSPTANSTTRAIANKQPESVQAMANLCGAGYVLQYAEQLPDSRRFGTLFTYQKNTSPFSSCAMFDNNLGTAKYMKLTLCPNQLSKPCSVDEGTFSQYAGPVRVTDGMCAEVTAIMKNSKSATTALIDRRFAVPPCN
ncbi:hypothetical protein H0E86_09900 [Streptomyces sp. SCSIO-PteL053]|nr:hypothetical protein H0E86_09900 [Streptomyces sp. SCSIO-PteL053]